MTKETNWQAKYNQQVGINKALTAENQRLINTLERNYERNEEFNRSFKQLLLTVLGSSDPRY